MSALRREAILDAVTFAGEQFLRRIPWTSCMDDVLERNCLAAGASRAYLFAFHTTDKDAPVASQRFEWTAEDATPKSATRDCRTLPRLEGGFARWASVLERREVVVGTLEDFSPQEQAMLEGQDILTLLLVPVFVEDFVLGLHRS